MNLMDIAGPIMVGPSSSHTAGACRIGYAARRILGEPVREAVIRLHGSFLTTGKGHGTDRALIAGLMGFEVDDPRIPDSAAWAKKAGLHVQMEGADLGDVHPNTVKLEITGQSGKRLELLASSVGGGRILMKEINGLSVNISGDYPTLIIRNMDAPGLVERVTGLIKSCSVNIAAMDLKRQRRGGEAVMILELDEELGERELEKLRQLDGVRQAAYFSLSASAKEDEERGESDV